MPSRLRARAELGDSVAWIKVRTNLHNDPRVAYVARATGLHPATVVGALVTLWSWADEFTTDGVLRYHTTADVDALGGGPIAERLTLSAALRGVGWLVDVSDGSPAIPRFDEHNGATAKSRAETARRVATHRARNGSTVTTALPKCDVTTALPREEKIRDTHATRVLRAHARKGGI